MYTITLIPGDGTGPEISEATRRVIEATGVSDSMGRTGRRGRCLRKGRNAITPKGYRFHQEEQGRNKRSGNNSCGNRVQERECDPQAGARPLLLSQAIKDIQGCQNTV